MDLTDGRLARLQKSKDARTKLKRYKKMYAQDSVQAYKERQEFLKDSLGSKRKLKQYNDSLHLKNLYQDNLNSYLGRTGIGQYKDQYKYTKDSLDIDGWKAQYMGRDSLALPDSLSGMAVMARYGMYGTMMDTYASRRGLPTDSSSLAQQLAIEERVKAYLPEELQGANAFGSFQNQFMGGTELDKDNPTAMLMEHLPPEKMQAATTAMTVLKKGFISVPNSNDLSQ